MRGGDVLPLRVEGSSHVEVDRRRIMAIVGDAIELVNRELDYDSLRHVSEETPIFGGAEGIDSLSLVMLIVELESRVEEELGVRVVLADAAAMSTRHSPYRTAGSLAKLILEKVNGSR
jgi:acyl carrier protein